MTSADQLIAEARSLLGVPWVHQGRSVAGLDCIGFVMLACKNSGLDMLAALGCQDRTDYGREPTVAGLQALQNGAVQIQEPEPGCLMFIRFHRAKFPQHFGILTREGTLIHAHSTAGRVVEHRYGEPWIRTTHSIWQIPGVQYPA